MEAANPDSIANCLGFRWKLNITRLRFTHTGDSYTSMHSMSCFARSHSFCDVGIVARYTTDIFMWLYIEGFQQGLCEIQITFKFLVRFYSCKIRAHSYYRVLYILVRMYSMPILLEKWMTFSV